MKGKLMKRWMLKDREGNTLSSHTSKSAAGRAADKHATVPSLFFFADGRWVEETWK